MSIIYPEELMAKRIKELEKALRAIITYAGFPRDDGWMDGEIHQDDYETACELLEKKP